MTAVEPVLPPPAPAREGGPAAAAPAAPLALVVFCDGTELAWLRLLKPGFRHVFVALRDGPHWVTLDPLSPHMEVVVQDLPPGFDLARWFRDRGLTVVETVPDRSRRTPAPWAPFTCVEAVKRVLGLHAPFILTPWQLYRRLTVPDRAAVPAATAIPAAAAQAAAACPART